MILLSVLLYVTTAAAFRRDFDTTRFDRFFPIHRRVFTAIRDGPCRQLYLQKKAGEVVCIALLDCMLEHTRESIKGDIASGVIALGLTPTILTFLGSNTAETGLLSRRRPLLAFLIALGAPSVSPIKTFDYPDPMVDLEQHNTRQMRFQLKTGTKQAALVTCLQYILVLGAVANVYAVCFYMASWTINTISCDTIHLPLVWAGASAGVHIFAVWSISLSVVTQNKPQERQSYSVMFSQLVKHELAPCLTHRKLKLERKPESGLYIVVAWFLSVFTVVHTLYGTIAFSSIQFIGT